MASPVFESHAAFPTTHWSIVHAGQDPASEIRQTAIARLYSAYSAPLYAFARKKGRSPEQAADVTQQFITDRVLNPEKQLLDQVNLEKCQKFRSFLLTAFTNYLLDDYRKSRTKRRAPAEPLVDFDSLSLEKEYQRAEDCSNDPSASYDRAWARSVFNLSLDRLRSIAMAKGQLEIFEVIRDKMEGRRAASYDTIAEKLGVTPEKIAKAVMRMKRKFRDAIEEEVRQTVNNDESFKTEIRFVREIISS